MIETDSIGGGSSGCGGGVSVSGTHPGHDVLGGVSTLLGLLELVLHLAIFGQVDGCDLLLHGTPSTTAVRISLSLVSVMLSAHVEQK